MKATKTIFHIAALVVLFTSCDKPADSEDCKLITAEIELEGTNVLKAVPSTLATAPFDYAWSNGVSGLSEITVSINGVYSVTITDFRGCEFSASYAYANPTTTTPVRLRIDSVKVRYFTKYFPGAADADSSGADVRLSITPGTQPDTLGFYSSEIFNNQESVPFSFSTDFPATFDADTVYAIGLWDDDAPNAAQTLGGVFFGPASYYTQPDTIQLSSIFGGYPVFTLYIKWEYQ